MKSLPQTPPVPEESLLEVWSRAAEPDVLYAMLTAYQFSCSHDENTARNCRLRADVREAGFGFWIINGFWFENESTPGQEYVAEESYFVSVTADSRKAPSFAKTVLQWASKYNQTGILLKGLDCGLQAIDIATGKSTPLGEFEPSRVALAYRQMRGRNNVPFLFNSAYCPGWFRALSQALLAKAQRTEKAGSDSSGPLTEDLLL